jgi:hypothetical protein
MRILVGSRTTLALSSLLVFTHVACASPPRPVKLDRTRLIQRDDGYQQDGKNLDVEDMVKKLSKEPAAAPHVSRSQALKTIVSILGGAGGGLIGWPIGGKLGGDDDPPWELAYVGVGTILLAIPLALWGDASLDSAVDAHNAALSTQPPNPP